MIMVSLYLSGTVITAISIWYLMLSNPSSFSLDLDPSPSKWDAVDFFSVALMGLVCGCIFPIILFYLLGDLWDWFRKHKTSAHLQNQADLQLLSWALSQTNVK